MTTPFSVFKTIVFTSDMPLRTMAKLAGVNPSVVFRLANAKHHFRFDDFFYFLALAGMGVLIRSPHAPGWLALISPDTDAVLPDGHGLSEMVLHIFAREIALPADNRHALGRLREGQLPPVIRTCLALLAVIQGELLALGGNGATKKIDLPNHEPDTIISAGHKNRKAPLRSGMPCNRSLLSKQEVITLYREGNLSCAQISAIADVSGERIRQILSSLGVCLSQSRRQKRISDCAGADRAKPEPLTASQLSVAQE